MSTIFNFLLRHRRKFFYAGALAIGLSFLNKFAANRIIQWHQTQSQSLIGKQKRKEHYEKLRQTAMSTVYGLSTSISKILIENLETDTILQAIKSHNGNKIQLWEQLKVLSFSRCVASAYVSSLLSAVVHVKIMVLGGYSFSGVTDTGNNGNRLSDDLQERYLLGIYSLIEYGIPLLTSAIHNSVEDIIGDLKLDRNLSLKQLETVLSDLCLFGSEDRSNAESDYIVKSKYLHFQSLIDEAKEWPESDKKHTLLKMLEETKEVIHTEDFKSLVLILVQNCLNNIMDRLAEHFKTSTDHNGEIDSKAISISGKHLSGTVPVAKLLPILSGTVTRLTVKQGELFSNVLINSHLEAFSFNVYETFSYTSSVQ